MSKIVVRSHSGPDPRSPVLFWSTQWPNHSASWVMGHTLYNRPAVLPPCPNLHLFSKLCFIHTAPPPLSLHKKPYRLILVVIRLEVTFPDSVTILMCKQKDIEVEKSFDTGNELLKAARRNYWGQRTFLSIPKIMPRSSCFLCSWWTPIPWSLWNVSGTRNPHLMIPSAYGRHPLQGIGQRSLRPHNHSYGVYFRTEAST